MLASGPVEQGFESTWGRVLVCFFLSLFCLYKKTYFEVRFFFVSANQLFVAYWYGPIMYVLHQLW